MKLLFDENVSPRLVAALMNDYPGSAHVRDVGLRGAADARILAVSVLDGHGVRRASGGASFDWRLSPSEWAQIDDLLEPFCSASDAESSTQFQYLNRHDGPEVIYSTARSW